MPLNVRTNYQPFRFTTMRTSYSSCRDAVIFGFICDSFQRILVAFICYSYQKRLNNRIKTYSSVLLTYDLWVADWWFDTSISTHKTLSSRRGATILFNRRLVWSDAWKHQKPRKVLRWSKATNGETRPGRSGTGPKLWHFASFPSLWGRFYNFYKKNEAGSVWAAFFYRRRVLQKYNCPKSACIRCTHVLDLWNHLET